MKNQNLIIAAVVLLILVMGGVGLFLVIRKTDSKESARPIALTNNPLRSGSLLDRINAEKEAGLYGKKGAEDATA